MVLATNFHHGDSSEDERERENVIHIGSAYQAVCPDLISSNEPCPDIVPDKALLVWHPDSKIGDNSLDDYICLAKEKYGYNAEQALGMLFWHRYDIDKAIHDLPNFTPFPDEWTVEDKVLFEQAFQFHGKNFSKIRQMLPDKTIPSLVKYYYSWKKTKNRISLMDRQARRLRGGNGEENSLLSGGNDEPGSDNATENDSDMESGGGGGESNFTRVKDKNADSATNKTEVTASSAVSGNCSNCGQSPTAAQSNNSSLGTSSNSSTNVLHSTPKGALCQTCNVHWKKNGLLLRTGSASSKHVLNMNGSSLVVTGADLKKTKKPPKGMYLKFEDLMVIASGPSGQGDVILKALDAELCSLKRQVQHNKAEISKLREDTLRGIEHLRPPEIASKTNPRWTNDEMLLAVQGVRKYGRDFQAIAEVMGNKSEAHVKAFYISNRHRYDLDTVIAEWEVENGVPSTKNTTSETSASSQGSDKKTPDDASPDNASNSGSAAGNTGSSPSPAASSPAPTSGNKSVSAASSSAPIPAKVAKLS